MMTEQSQPMLFDEQAAPVPEVAQAQAVAVAVARVLMPNRTQLELRACDLESLLPEGHRARLVWAWVERADLSGMYAGIRAVEGGSGRSAIAPEILFALWLYATLEGVGSARALARLTQAHDAYRWICGGVSVNYHTLSDFRSAHGEALDGLLSDSVAALLSVGAVSLKRVAQDGTRVRASAGAASFRRGATLEACLQEARTQVECLKRQIDEDPGALTRRQQAARERAVRERQERLERALARLPEMAEIKAKQGKPREAARVSTTDAEATVMKMADGGYRPAYNLQFATDAGAQVIVGVDASNAGTDHGQLAPMVAQIEARHQQPPAATLVDGGFATKEDIAAVSDRTTVYAPVQKPKTATRNPHEPLPTDTPAVAAWRQRMGTPEAQTIYKDRAATAECVNAQARNRGLRQLGVRGLAKVRTLALWYAVAHNLARAIALGAVAGVLSRG